MNKKGSGMAMASEIVAEKAMEIIDQTQKNRESRHILTRMKVLHGNIENAVFAAELRRSDEFRCEGGPVCDFRKKGECIVPKIRELLGNGFFENRISFLIWMFCPEVLGFWKRSGLVQTNIFDLFLDGVL